MCDAVAGLHDAVTLCNTSLLFPSPQALAVGGLGSIVRVLTARKTV